MNCKAARLLIHLREGGDANERETRRLESHLERCTRCSDYAAGLVPLSLASFRQSQPLNETDFTSIRREVMENLSRRRPGAGWFTLRYAIPATIVVALVVIGFAIRRSDDGSIESPTRVVPAIPTQVVEESPEPPATQLETNPLDEARGEPARIAATTIPARVDPGTREPGNAISRGTEVAEAPKSSMTIADRTPQPAPVRIELKTRDPNIRIIWIANNPSRQSTDALDGTSGT